MGTIYYSMCGEGRGHAARVQTIVDLIVPRHRFVLLAARDAYLQLYERYQDHPLVSVRRLPGLFFAYRDSKLDYARSLVQATPYLWRLSSMVQYIVRMMERDQPILAITDFEPLLPRAAQRFGIRSVSLDHQHFLSVSCFRNLPWRFRWRALFLRVSIPLFYRNQAGLAVSSFAHLPSRKGMENIPRIGVLLRESVREIAKSNRKNSGHILVYIRRHAPPSLFHALKNCGKPCFVYGLGPKEPMQQIQFKSISDEEFVSDLASSECLISTAGNQLIGEAFYLQKPVLAIPEQGNFEQDLNSWLISKSGGGWRTTFEALTPHLLQQFLVALPLLREQLKKIDVCGNQQALDFICQFLSNECNEEVPFANRNYWEAESVTNDFKFYNESPS